MKTANELLNYLKAEFSPSDFNNNKELAMLSVYCINNKKMFLSAFPDRISHFYKKYCNLYSIDEMLNILKINGGMNTLSAKLVNHLRNEQIKGRIKFISNNNSIKMLVVKYL